MATIRGWRGEEEGGETAKRGNEQKGGKPKGWSEKTENCGKRLEKVKKKMRNTKPMLEKPNGRLEKLRRNLKTQGWEVVVVVAAGGLVSIRCR